MAVSVSFALIVTAITVAVVLVSVAFTGRRDAVRAGTTALEPLIAPDPPRLRLVSRLLFVLRQSDSIALDCTLLEAHGSLPEAPTPPVGAPFTVQLRAPETHWFADRVEELLTQWAVTDRPLVLDLVETAGQVKATLTSGDSSLRLDLAGAAGLGSDLPG